MMVLFVFFSFVWGQPFTIIGYIGSTLNIFFTGQNKGMSGLYITAHGLNIEICSSPRRQVNNYFLPKTAAERRAVKQKTTAMLSAKVRGSC